jgi:CheY-like chemotaxis protein
MSSRANADGNAVLVIDDSDIDRETMASILTDAGFKVHTQPSPIGATKTARELGVRVVVIDQNLPAMDGSKLALLFRSNPVLRAVRLVLVSGLDETAMAELAKKAQADAFITKSAMHRELAATVRRLNAAAPTART